MRFATVITDCADGNAAMRQSIAWQIHAQARVTTITPIIGDVDGAGQLADALVETRGQDWVVFCQSAPRDGVQKRWVNGTPFGYFWYRSTLVLASVDGFMLSLVKKLGFLSGKVQVMDIPTVLDYMVRVGRITDKEAEVIKRTQFRSLKFAPLAAAWIYNNVDFPKKELCACEVPDLGPAVWLADNFGNCKTTLQARDVGYQEGKVLRTDLGDFDCIPDLRKVPDGQQAATLGSSGFEGNEWIELVVQGVNCGSAAKRFDLRAGSEFQVLGCE